MRIQPRNRTRSEPSSRYALGGCCGSQVLQMRLSRAAVKSRIGPVYLGYPRCEVSQMFLMNRQQSLLLTVVVYLIIVRVPVSFSFASPTLPERYVYVWFPDGTLRRLSPAPGFFVQPCVRPDGKAAVFWGGAEGRPRVWLSEFASNAARPITASGVGSVEPTFEWLTCKRKNYRGRCRLDLR